MWLIADSSDLRKPYAEVMPYLMQVPDLRSEPAEVQEALLTVSQALTSLKEHQTITWLLDSGFDDIAIWRTMWEAQEHLVCRVSHLERLVSFQDRTGQWQEGNLGQARGHLRNLARVQATLVAKRGKQPRAKKQPVEVEVAACPARVTTPPACGVQLEESR